MLVVIKNIQLCQGAADVYESIFYSNLVPQVLTISDYVYLVIIWKALKKTLTYFLKASHITYISVRIVTGYDSFITRSV